MSTQMSTSTRSCGRSDCAESRKLEQQTLQSTMEELDVAKETISRLQSEGRGTSEAHDTSMEEIHMVTPAGMIDPANSSPGLQFSHIRSFIELKQPIHC